MQVMDTKDKLLVICPIKMLLQLSVEEIPIILNVVFNDK